VDDAHAERNGYWFWGLMALFIGVPEILAGLSSTLKADIPWPTISNLVGRHLERRHHWVALLVMGVIVVVAYHAATYERQRQGHAIRKPADDVDVWTWGGWYIVGVAVAGAAAGLIASALGANKVALGFAIYITLTVAALAPSVLAYVGAKVLDVPTLFTTVSDLQKRAHWAAAATVALLVVLMFHLALYPWPNYPFGGP
jgi:hypothetical protein